VEIARRVGSAENATETLVFSGDSDLIFHHGIENVCREWKGTVNVSSLFCLSYRLFINYSLYSAAVID
jgi:hypothetical protein